VADLEGYQRIYKDKIGSELMVWTAGGHYFRGELSEFTADGFLVLKEVSCTLAGERQERESVYISAAAIDAIS
jgi:small nuclear ribonucleoprotein (snRNP)-like protein